MAKSESLELVGVINEALAGNMFRVQVQNIPHLILCYMGGRLKQNKIKVLEGDTVKLEVSIYDPTRGRIVYRL